MDAPTYEEPMPEDEVAAQIASDLESTAPSIDLPVAGTEETVVGEEDIYTSDDGLFQYKLVGEKVHIVSCADELEDVVIPETIDDVEVNYIEAGSILWKAKSEIGCYAGYHCWHRRQRILCLHQSDGCYAVQESAVHQLQRILYVYFSEKY